MPRKKQIHAAQTDLLPAEKKEIPAGDVRLYLKNLTLLNMQWLKEKIKDATVKEHEIIQNAINAALKGADVVPYYPNAKTEVNVQLPQITIAKDELDL